MKVYLVSCVWYDPWLIGIFSSSTKANEAIEKHVAWLRNEIPNSNFSKNDYDISEIPLDKIDDRWYNESIKSKE